MEGGFGSSKGIVHQQRPSDVKLRLKWTRQLHERFVEAVHRLGGAEKATPKSVMRTMDVPGLTLYHLKSHLQKYRLARNQKPHTFCNDEKEECLRHNTPLEEYGGVPVDTTRTQQPLFHESMVYMQMEVQRKLREQMDVQRDLQVRIEAQGKYLASVLKRAQETLEVYNLNSTTKEKPVVADVECLSTSISIDSCLTSSEKRDDEEKLCRLEIGSASVDQPVAADKRAVFVQGSHAGDVLQVFDLNK